MIFWKVARIGWAQCNVQASMQLFLVLIRCCLVSMIAPACGKCILQAHNQTDSKRDRAQSTLPCAFLGPQPQILFYQHGSTSRRLMYILLRIWQDKQTASETELTQICSPALQGPQPQILFCQHGSTSVRLVYTVMPAPVAGQKSSKEKQGAQLKGDNKKPIVAMTCHPSGLHSCHQV